MRCTLSPASCGEAGRIKPRMTLSVRSSHVPPNYHALIINHNGITWQNRLSSPSFVVNSPLQPVFVL
jgi:hypothetical protein